MRTWILFCFIFPISIYSQHIPVYPGLEGEELLESIRTGYTPESTLGYSKARDTLFRNILAVDNVIKCIYTDWAITLDPSKDPTDDAYNQKINSEHLYPQSKGAEYEPMRSNMYNLFPVRENVNTDRSNDPFGEVQDNKAQWWYYQDIRQKEIPTTNIDLYSEKGEGKFEPKENRKGDIARSIMYFYTVYRSTCDAADPNYFLLMSEDLCKWHYADPVDTDEWNRNILISAYQNNKSNPFVLDCTLPERSYCSGLGLTCTPTGSNNRNVTIQVLKIFPSSGVAGSPFKINTPGQTDKIFILDSTGKKIEFNLNDSGKTIRLIKGTPGLYFIFSTDTEGRINGYGKYIML